LRNSSINLCLFLTQRNALRQSASTAEALWADGLALATPVTVLLGTGRTVKGVRRATQSADWQGR